MNPNLADTVLRSAICQNHWNIKRKKSWSQGLECHYCVTLNWVAAKDHTLSINIFFITINSFKMAISQLDFSVYESVQLYLVSWNQ